ncbi:VOC family protein [Pseudoalteromonas sp. APC 3355]|uniref:VOC family protein n=1 Tax=Pseudoalteromonas sp. APC 3355 TaxID=3035199 RepID=UPI0025B3FC59|nr:VOC family protein [Pseudoalteromonas sp. APC 3355]MDN3474295.1 VOC family protein [Pseudoalteromonas sp. APC 3355]
MSGPARFGAIIYAGSVKRLSAFYLEMFGLRVLRETNDLVSLGGEGFNIVVHVPPVELPDTKFNTVKVFVAVDSLEDAKRRAMELGGKALEGEWSNPVFKVCNIADPEGNHIQLREFML